MANPQMMEFSKRLNRIDGAHRKMSRGYVQLVERDGMLVPKHARVRRRGFPLRGLALSLGAFMLFKGFLLAEFGAVTYDERLGKLAEGNIVEQIGAWMMGADPVTVWIATQIGTFF